MRKLKLKINIIEEIAIKVNNHEIRIQQLNTENGTLKQKNDEKEK